MTCAPDVAVKREYTCALVAQKGTHTNEETIGELVSIHKTVYDMLSPAYPPSAPFCGYNLTESAGGNRTHMLTCNQHPLVKNTIVKREADKSV